MQKVIHRPEILTRLDEKIDVLLRLNPRKIQLDVT